MIASEALGSIWRYNIEIYFTAIECDHLRCVWSRTEKSGKLFSTW
jgi:hypothetical protein